MKSLRFGSVIVLALALALGMPADAAAQQQLPRQQAPARGAQGQNRMVLERRVRERIQRVMREELQLTPDQSARLQQTLVSFEERRRALLREDRRLRLSLRDAMGGDMRATPPASVDSAAVARALDDLIRLQRRRIDLLEAEQRELATYLTPVQRARFFALQDNLRRMLDERAPPGRAGSRPPEDEGPPPPAP